MKLYGQEPYIITDTHWFNSYNKEKVIVVEDLDYITATKHAHSLKHWADRYASKAEIKGSMIWL